MSREKAAEESDVTSERPRPAKSEGVPRRDFLTTTAKTGAALIVGWRRVPMDSGD
jgi:hypothetical protein